eukprot:scaffold9862_cov118-Isochrysis_galbana.AAC.2
MAAPAQNGGDSTYDEAVTQFESFLQDFQAEDDVGEMVPKYMQVLTRVANREERRVEIELDDVADHMGEEMADAVRGNTLRYRELIGLAIDRVMPAPTDTVRNRDVYDVLMEARVRAAAAAAAQAEVAAPDPANLVPPALSRRFNVYVLPRVKEKAVPLREVKAKHIGALLTMKGIVTRVTEVKPLMRVATYTCEQGGSEVYQMVTSATFMPLNKCPVASCCNGGNLNLQTRGSKFEKFQEVKIQEEPDQVCALPLPVCPAAFRVVARVLCPVLPLTRAPRFLLPAGAAGPRAASHDCTPER